MTTTDETMIELIKVNKSYQKGAEQISVLRDLNLEISRCEFVAIMGPSGSGKTTMLNLVGGLDRVTSGSIKIRGQSIEKMTESALADWRSANVGFVFQFYNLLDVLSARNNVELPLLLTRLSAKQRRYRADLALELVGLSDRGEHRPNELSGGQQQRVAIARAIVNDPSLIVCDEPTGDLDRETADQVLNLLRSLKSDHDKTILMVTHDPKAAAVADRCLQMDKGLLVPDSTIPEIVST